MKNTLENIVIYTSRKESCSYEVLESIGMIPLKNLALAPGKDIEDKTYTWLNANWMHNMNLTRTIVAIINEYNKEDKLSIAVSSEAAKRAFNGVVKFMKEKYPELSHLIAVYFPNLTVGGRPLPPISKEFNNMSFTERQAILKANNDAKVELVEN